MTIALLAIALLTFDGALRSALHLQFPSAREVQYAGVHSSAISQPHRFTQLALDSSCFRA
jgi:hypothetical protein